MNTLELIKDAALFGGTIPNERAQEVRDFLDNVEKQLNLACVINWVAIKDDQPSKRQEVFTYSEEFGVNVCGYESPYWKMANITHWASTENVKPPCL